MKGAHRFFSMLMFLGTVYSDSVIPSINIGSAQKNIESFQLSLPAINASDVPAWVDKWKLPKFLRKLFPLYISGYDFEGSPVYVMEYGHWKAAEALRSYKDGPEKAFDLLVKYLDQTMYRIYADGLANNDQGIALILDYDGFALSNYGSQLALKGAMRQLATLDQLNKVLNYAFLININFAAENLLLLGRPLLGNILDKCETYGTQKYKWLPHLARKIPTHQLPPWYGGPEDWTPVTIGLEPFNSTQVKST